jgi:hypothetical protein
MKIKLLAAVAAVAAAAGMATPAAGATESAETCSGDYIWQVSVDRLHVWESENYEERETSISRGKFLRGPSGRRDSGWVPVQFYWNGSAWASLLSGTNDTNDFVRSSGLAFYGCN